MNLESKTAQLITKLIRETSKGNVKWVVRQVPRALDHATEKVVPLFLQAEYKGKRLGLYGVRAKSFYNEDEYYWSESIGFCVMDNQDRVIWESEEYSAALLDLFTTAREQASGIDEILDDLLDDK